MGNDHPDGYRDSPVNQLPGLLSQSYQMYHDVQYQEITTENWGQFISNRFDAGYVYVLRDFRISQPEGKEFYACLFLIT